MKLILVPQEFRGHMITREDGERLRFRILESIREGTEIELDFQNRMIASSSFLDESLVKLPQEGFSHEQISTLLKLKKLHIKDFELLQKLWKLRNGKQSACPF